MDLSFTSDAWFAVKPIAIPFAMGLLTREVAKGGSLLFAFLRKRYWTAPIAGLVPVAEDVLEAAASAAIKNLGNKPADMAEAALKAAEGAVEADKGAIVAAVVAEAQALASPPAETTVVANVTVTLPKLGA